MPTDFINEMRKKRNRRQRVHFRDDLKSSFEDIYNFYLDPKKRRHAQTIPPLFRWLYISFWLSRGIISTLSISKFRWLLVLFSFILFFNAQDNSSPIAYFILFLVLLLELRDKIIAKDELQAGSAVQTALMPEQKPDIPGWDAWLYTRPANQVGGDYLDCIQPNSTATHLGLGDVSGKGLPAALLMAKLQASIETLAPTEESIETIGAQLNRLICANSLKNKFISLFYFKLQHDNADIEYLNAGHLPPFIMQNGIIIELPKGDPALGLSKATQYKTGKFSLKPGDTFLAFTDGISEARNENGNFYSEQRIENILKINQHKNSEEIGLALLSDVKKFIGRAPVHDDLTMLVLKRTSRSSNENRFD